MTLLWTSKPSDWSPAMTHVARAASRSVVTQTFEGTATTASPTPRSTFRSTTVESASNRGRAGRPRGGRSPARSRRPGSPATASGRYSRSPTPSPNEMSAAETAPSGIASASAGAISQRAPPLNAAAASSDADRDHRRRRRRRRGRSRRPMRPPARSRDRPMNGRRSRSAIVAKAPRGLPPTSMPAAARDRRSRRRPGPRRGAPGR